MRIEDNNLFLHADGGYYCLLSDNAPMKHPDSGFWIDGVIYTGVDGQMRSTSRDRWLERFKREVIYTGDDEEVAMMIRRCNPGSSDLDFVKVFESWHESEVNITGHMLELAVAATIERFIWNHDNTRNPLHTLSDGRITGTELTITTEDLQHVLQNYEIERIPQPHGFTFKIEKSFSDG